jgi:tripartite-type tricarboxylate transporter receptor subunit TctC
MVSAEEVARPVPRRRVLAIAGGMAAAGRARSDPAESDWPARAVRYIDPFPTRGKTDLLSRLFCAKMSELSGRRFAVENLAGAGGTVGQAAIARAAADGHTLGLGSVASLAVAPSVHPGLPYDPARDFTFVSGLWQTPNILICDRDLPVRSVPELVALLERNPGRYVHASPDPGTTPHLAMELFKRVAGVDVAPMPDRGGADAIIDLLGGRVHLMVHNLPTAIVGVREREVRALAVTGAERSPAMPEVPAMAEFYPGFEVTSWGGLVGPAGLPPRVVERLSRLTKQALDSPDLVETFREHAATPWWTTPEDLARFRAEQERLFAGLVEASAAAGVH